jgi:hypothetical protein
MKDIAILAAVVNLFIVSGCGPIKGYPGPDRPSFELVTIATSSTSARNLTLCEVDGIAFAARPVQILPGHHLLRTQLKKFGIGENCGMDRELDNCPTCRQTREAHCRRDNPNDPALCSSLWQREEMHVMCDYEHLSFDCSLETTISEPGIYEISVTQESDGVRLTGAALDVPFRCSYLGRTLHRERMDGVR